LPRKSTTFFQKALQFLLMSFLYTLLIATIECEQRMYDEGFIIIIIIIIFFSEWFFSFWWQKSGGANDTTNFLNNNNNNGPKSPYYDNVEMFFWSHHIWTLRSNIPTCHHNRGGILTFFLLCSLTNSQIWLKSSCEWSPTHQPHKFGKRKNTNHD
jgi:hypothetical protein